MAYSPTYTSSDLSAIIIDFIGTYWVQLVAFAALFALGLAMYLINKYNFLGAFGMGRK